MDWLLMAMPLILLGRVQEVFRVLWPLRLVLVMSIVLMLAIVSHQGLAKPRLALFWRSMTFRWFAAMLAIMFVSIFTGIYPSHSLSFFKEFCMYFCVVLLALNCQVNQRDDFRYSLGGIALTLFVMGVICFVAPRYVEGNRVAANWSYDPNDTALFFIMGLALILPSAKFVKPMYKWGLYLLTVIGVGAVVLTQSRGGLVAALVTVAAWGFSKGFKGMVRIGLLGALALAVIMALAPAEDLARFSSVFTLESDYNMTSKGGRMDIWENGWTLFKRNPILGTGVDTFRVAEGQVNSGGRWSEAHNSFIQVGVELGIPGFIVFMGMLFSAYKRAKPTDENDWLGRGIRLALIGFMAGGMFLSWGYHIVLYFVLSIAMIRERVLTMESPFPVEVPVAEVPVREAPVPSETPDLPENAPLAGRRRYTMRKPK
ncbi:O-antigen polymerase [Pseudodesulfovibrio mercurii]|uniref:O-antigen polymerase n=1 Tax=Pseudodesulfovibrio mercurii TaxID=641491 RepID=F0JCA8_9BACT|nr:O-antigen ligase family protein [Pseudodesulfovibrio mercurii]EGB14406.1 O-antigen polymerase [Pseudodesulfovibrio mercurii]